MQGSTILMLRKMRERHWLLPSAKTSGSEVEEVEDANTVSIHGESVAVDTRLDSEILSIDMSLFGISAAAIVNIEKLVASKTWILKKMTGAEALPIEKLEDRLRFPWFKSDSSAKEIDAYSRLITRLCETAKGKKHVSAEERLPQLEDNEKYKARCFLLSLDFKGSEYSQARKILLEPFPGNGSFLQGTGKKKIVLEGTELMADVKVITTAMLENASFTDIAKPGDFVEDEIADSFLGCVPPATHLVNLIQCGEPYSSAWNEESQSYSTTYLTFSFVGSMWKYNGTCFLGKTEHRDAQGGDIDE